MTIRGRSVTSGRMSLSPTSVTSIDKTCYNTWHENLVSFGIVPSRETIKNFCMNDCELAKSKKHSSLLLWENVKNKRTVYFLELQNSVKISNIFWLPAWFWVNFSFPLWQAVLDVLCIRLERIGPQDLRKDNVNSNFLARQKRNNQKFVPLSKQE